MYLIYVTECEEDGKKTYLRDLLHHVNDVEPIIATLLFDFSNLILLDQIPINNNQQKYQALNDILRISIDDFEVDSIADRQINKRRYTTVELQNLVSDGKFQLAVSLATIYFAQGFTNPAVIDYIEHVRERTRLADRLLVVGYTDSVCQHVDSEYIAFKRAEAVKETLVAGLIEVPINTIARPLCRFAHSNEASRRVEIIALYEGTRRKSKRGKIPRNNKTINCKTIVALSEQEKKNVSKKSKTN